MPLQESSLPDALLQAIHHLVAWGLIRGSEGNVSVRDGDGFWITPSGMNKETASADDMVWMSLAGDWHGSRKPSSEWRFHRDIYQHTPQAGAVVHTHAPFATTLACLRRDIPPFHYMIARFGGHDIRCADYARFGTQALSDALLSALAQRRACLLANHGMVVYGADLHGTCALAQELETLCEQYWRACSLGQPVLLSAEEMDGVLADFRDYGQPAPPRQD